MFLSPFPQPCAFKATSISEFRDFSELSSKLHPLELELSQRFRSAERRSEFACGRISARAALSDLGDESGGPLLRAESGSVVWPRNFVGSIAHSSGVAVAVVARTKDFRCLGIDIQATSLPRDPKLLERIATPQERAWVDSGAADRGRRLYCLFSAKESAYKALHPLCGIALSFQDVDCHWTSEANSFSMILLRTIGEGLEEGRAFPGVCSQTITHVLTGVMI